VAITLDRDFPQILALTAATRPSVVLIRRQRLRALELALLIDSIWRDHESAGRGFERIIRLGGSKGGSGRRPAMSLVLDSSVTLAWVYSDEAREPIRDVFNLVGENGAWVPGLWKLEVAHILVMGVRRGRHDAAFRSATLADLALLPISVDAETDGQAWGATLQLSERHRLTLYDTAYLELALRRGLPLATLDAELRRAAQAEGVVVLGS
jgi:predicted nucleic acid-binding protein